MPGALTSGGLWLAVASAVPADQGPTELQARLDYGVAEDAHVCPDERAFRDTVVGRIGRDPFAASAAARVVVRLSRNGDGFVGSIVLEDASQRAVGERAFRGVASCDELAEAIALGLTVVLDPFAEEPVELDEPPSEHAPPPQDSPTPPVLETTPSADRRFAIGLLAATQAGFGLTPGPTLGANVGVGVTWPRAQIWVQARGEFQISARPVGPRDRVRADVLQAGVIGCLVPKYLRACAGALGGAFIGRALDVTDPRPHTSGVVTGELSLGPRFAVRRVWLAPFVAARAPVIRTTLAIDDVAIWTAPPISVSVGLVVEASL